MKEIARTTTLKDLAVMVAVTLQSNDIDAVLVGGAAVSLYSDNVYQTYDLDYVTRHTEAALSAALQPLGFIRSPGSRHWIHPETDFMIEFPGDSLSFGETDMPFSSATTLSLSSGSIRVITPTQSVMDRLAAFTHWNDRQSLEQAKMISADNSIDWVLLHQWALTEGIDASIIDNIKP